MTCCCLNGTSRLLDWMQCGKACVEWVAKLSPPTLPLFEKWQRPPLRGQTVYFLGEQPCLSVFPLTLQNRGTKHLLARLFVLFTIQGIVLHEDKLRAVLLMEDAWMQLSVEDYDDVTIHCFCLVVKGTSRTFTYENWYRSKVKRCCQCWHRAICYPSGSHKQLLAGDAHCCKHFWVFIFSIMGTQTLSTKKTKALSVWSDKILNQR